MRPAEMEEAVRVAVPADLPELVAMAETAADEVRDHKGGQRYLDREARQGDLRTSFEAQMGRPDAIVVIGTIDDVAVGFSTAAIEELPTTSTIASLGEIWVLEGFRGVSIGELMLAHIRAWATDQGCTHLEGWVHPGNRHAKNFFETAGMVTRLLRVSTKLTASEPETEPPAS